LEDVIGNGSGLGMSLRVVETGLDFGMDKQIPGGLFRVLYIPPE
jgi:hypothetical protein